MKKGFTLIELLVSIVVIGILMTIGYKGYTAIISNAKASKVVSEIDKAKQAVANTLSKTGGYFQSTVDTPKAYGPNNLKPEEPGTNCGSDTSDPDVPTTIQYAADSGAEQDTTCYAHKIERVFHNELLKMGFRWVPSSDNPNVGEFRLTSFPLAKLVFPMQVNGVRVIKIQGIPGNIAVRVLKKINDTDRITDKDGWNREKPLAIISYAASKPGVESDCLSNLDTLDTVQKSFICVATGKTSITDAYGTQNSEPLLFAPGSEDKVSNYAQVGLSYTYQFGDRWDGTGGTAEDTTTAAP